MTQVLAKLNNYNKYALYEREDLKIPNAKDVSLFTNVIALMCLGMFMCWR